MAKKYTSTLTAKLTPEGWKEELNLSELSLNDLTDLVGDFKKMEKFGKQLSGFLKEAIRARIPEDEDFYQGPHWTVQFKDCSRVAALDEDKITEEMGEDWLEDHRKPPIEYTEMRVKAVEAA